MLNSLRKTTSLNNFSGGNLKGQIATLLMLMMVVVLIFILFTVNLGQLSLTATQLSNAADAAALSLVSQLASKTHILFEGLKSCEEDIDWGPYFNSPRCCSRQGGWLDIFLAIIVIIVALLTVQPELLPLAVITGGSAGGAVGGGIQSGTWNGAALGAFKGYGLGLTVVGGMGFGVETLGMNAASIWPAVFAITISAGPQLWAELSAAKTYGDFLDSFYNSLRALDEPDRYREGAFSQVWLRTVDDPTPETDTEDSDGDGNITEKVPALQVWLDKRVKHLACYVKRLRWQVAQLGGWGGIKTLDTTLKCSYEFCYYNPPVPGPLRKEEQWHDVDGIVSEVCRVLENSGIDISFWAPTTPSAPDDPPPILPPDEVDKMVSFFATVRSMAYPFTVDNPDYEALAKRWKDWVPVVYNPNTVPLRGIYYELEEVITDEKEGVFKKWMDEIEAKKMLLPNECELGEIVNGVCKACSGSTCSKNCYYNWPCKEERPDGQNFATIDWDDSDEFVEATIALQEIRREIKEFLDYAKPILDRIYCIGEHRETGALNPATYSWHDSRCLSNDTNDKCHSITIEVSDFKIPRYEGGKIDETWYGTEIHCTGIIDHTGGEWVRVTRQDPVKKEVKSGRFPLGLFSPYDNEDPGNPCDNDHDGKLSITRWSSTKRELLPGEVNKATEIYRLSEKKKPKGYTLKPCNPAPAVISCGDNQSCY